MATPTASIAERRIPAKAAAILLIGSLIWGVWRQINLYRLHPLHPALEALGFAYSLLFLWLLTFVWKGRAWALVVQLALSWLYVLIAVSAHLLIPKARTPENWINGSTHVVIIVLLVLALIEERRSRRPIP